MLFRDKDGNLLNIKRKDFYRESDYYNKILNLKGHRLLDLVDEYGSEQFIFEKMNELMNGCLVSK